MTATAPPTPIPTPVADPAPPASSSRRTATPRPERARSILSTFDWKRRSTRIGWRSMHTVLLVALVALGAVPLLWMVRAAISTTTDLVNRPLSLIPDPARWSNIVDAWNLLGIGQYLANTVGLVAGSWAVQLIVATTAGFALAIIRPFYGRIVYGGFLVTLFVPGTVTLIALYLTILDLPGLGISLADSWWAVWLPAGAHAFNILLVRQFFDEIPRELFEAAQIDGAGWFTIFWRIVLPLSKPILAVVSLLSIMTAWKDFLWPLIVLSDPATQPLAVALPRLAQNTDPAFLIAGLLIATIPPILIFLAFQRQIVSGIGFSGLKG
ncbi:multiple sugar transport system permease protein [Labedella gwakjiensis]|uniref:Carbohydrate ABC transporter permease n=1 Tax=Labedella gwakjiensis TaxID=390269 RepID=A0A2P8GUH9_9MICO|nr:carbohydrate ABC transporter permease [Labedella gwakjiensis]PSL37618.1 multiple sugar transport system permease protein [Labedella gwakjiensis]RUQ81711.1 carbohydrate ABC transporter permease [Labedella gwakjiensis]